MRLCLPMCFSIMFFFQSYVSSHLPFWKLFIVVFPVVKNKLILLNFFLIRFLKINLNRKIYLKANMNFHIRLPPYYFSLSVVMIIALYIRMIAMVILDCIFRFGETLFKQTNTAIALLRNIQ